MKYLSRSGKKDNSKISLLMYVFSFWKIKENYQENIPVTLSYLEQFPLS